MTYLAWIITVIAAFWLGYNLAGIIERIESIKVVVKEATQKPPEEEPKSMLVDELDEVQKARFEHEQLMKRLNQ